MDLEELHFSHGNGLSHGRGCPRVEVSEDWRFLVILACSPDLMGQKVHIFLGLWLGAEVWVIQRC